MIRVKKIVKIFLGIPLTIIAFIFVGKILFDSLPKIIDHLKSADPLLLLIGAILMLGFFLVRAVAWTKIVEFYTEKEKSVSESVYLYSLAETKRYIPGNIFSFVSRIQKFSTEKFPKTTIIKALGLEAIIMVISAGIISIPAILSIFSSVKYSLLAFFPLILIPLFIFLVYKNVLKIRSLALSIFPKKNIFDYINLLSISTFAWVLFGFANYFFMAAIFPNDPNTILKISSIFILSWLIGYLSFVAPMGLGVREAVLIYLLAPFSPLYANAAIAIFTRILFVISEILFLGVSLLFHKKIKLTRKSENLIPIIIVAISSFTYITYTIFFSISKHINFYTGKFDLGNMENTVWNTVHGRFFVFSNPDGMGELSRLSAHADFILVLFAPFYAIYPSANVLLIAQSLIIGLGGFFIYLIAKKADLSEKIAALLSIGYFLNCFIIEQNLFDFHAISLATTFLLGAFYFLLLKKYRLMTLMLLFAVLCKENVYLVAGIFGAFLYFKGKKKFGAIVMVGSFLMFYLLMSYFIPTARSGDHLALEYLTYLGTSPLEIIFSPILKPEIFFSQVFRIETLDYIRLNLIHTGFLSLISPLYLIFALPDFFINILSDNPNLRSDQFHYGALIAPFVYISTILGIKKLLKLKVKLISKNSIFYYLLFFILFSAYLYSPLPGARKGDTSAFRPDPNRTMVLTEIAKIPEEKSVSATNNIAAHLVQREKIYVIPNVTNSVDYLVFYKNNLDLAQEILMVNDKYVEIFNSNNLVILKRFITRDRAYKP